MRASFIGLLAVSVVAGLAVEAADAGYTNNIMMTGYWPPTNEMVRRFSTNPEQNPNGWLGENWEGRGYNVHSFFPEFPDGQPYGQGVGDFEVDYQDTSEDFWRIVNEVKPVALITFSRGSLDRSWEVEWRQRNLDNWIDDYTEPYQPTPSPPDASVPADYIRYSTLPMQDIVNGVNAASDDLNVDAFVDDTGFGGGYLSEFMAYHGTWYHDLHSDENDPFWNVAAGHIHVGGRLGRPDARGAMRITLRSLIDHVDTIVPEPGTALLLGCGLLVVGRRRR